MRHIGWNWVGLGGRRQSQALKIQRNSGTIITRFVSDMKQIAQRSPILKVLLYQGFHFAECLKRQHDYFGRYCSMSRAEVHLVKFRNTCAGLEVLYMRR